MSVFTVIAIAVLVILALIAIAATTPRIYRDREHRDEVEADE